MTSSSEARQEVVTRRYRLEWMDEFILRISSAADLAAGPIHGVGRLDLGNGVVLGVDPQDVAAPCWVEVEDCDAARIALQGIFGWDSWPALRDALNDAEEAIDADLDVRSRFSMLADAATVMWVDRYSPLPLRQELLDFELGARLVLACSEPVPRRQAMRLLRGVADRLLTLVLGFIQWGPDVAQLLGAAQAVFHGSRYEEDFRDVAEQLRVGEAADLDLDWLVESSRALGMARASQRPGSGVLLLPVDWDRLPPRVVSGLMETPVRLDLLAGGISVEALLDHRRAVLRPCNDLAFSIYRNGARVTGLTGSLRLSASSQRYEGRFDPPTDPRTGEWAVDISTPSAVAAVHSPGPQADRAAQHREAVRALVSERASGGEHATSSARRTLAEQRWLAEAST